tara:strand:- start:2051 stop:2437 length:387 start_codon:yes stop_codon:yes gene_type:complete
MPYDKEYQKKYRELNKEIIAILRAENSEKRIKYDKEYRIKNKEYLTEYMDEYLRENDDKIKIISWRSQGMKLREGEDWISIYIHYNITDECELCGIKFKNSKNKHLDHDHDSGFVRDVLCARCNIIRQ